MPGVIRTRKSLLFVTVNRFKSLKIYGKHYWFLDRPDQPRYLWADVACIDQQNLSERSAQVKLMARTYSQASRVLMWLGHSDENTIQIAFQYLCQLGNSSQENDRLKGVQSSEQPHASLRKYAQRLFSI